MQGSTTNVGFVYNDQSLEMGLLKTILETLNVAKISYTRNEANEIVELNLNDFIRTLSSQNQATVDNILKQGFFATVEIGNSKFEVLFSKEIEDEKKCILIWFQDRFFLNTNQKD